MNNLDSLCQSRLFSGISPNDIPQMLKCLSAKRKEYAKDEMVVREGDLVDDVGIILQGSAQSTKLSVTGKQIIVSLHYQGGYTAVLTAASRGRRCPMSVQAIEPLEVLFIPIKSILSRCTKFCMVHEQLLGNLFDSIAERALELHDRNDCLIMPTIRDKVLTYLTRVMRETGTETFTIPFDREAMAEYLDVDRSALSRELAWMKRDGLIDFYRNEFKLLQKQ
ncbi:MULTISPECIES: Crp/Fnr family transcriptional regulator [Paenibacillus]|uniref:Crp/Fnr family transcriptional regulator n=1 Tax=Paenibacillus ottowii TaxID=2315729 RepID=A0ABY3B2D3_9BACL|nr:MULTISPECIES: Crp/Fnr family transcriptional regulator [Paenibacillus]KZE74521.1 transcriptional regulator [Paenibacillus jamilae]NEU28556.1 Crp/Fnr family transcriptional regulator [Paenibacillus polymyxa]OBA02856.1 transcriptional regulator [Paenibacillus polymyxa]TQR97885.1 Crp/Fnr family transcriptional regulator [Paenibacillus ottowii]